MKLREVFFATSTTFLLCASSISYAADLDTVPIEPEQVSADRGGFSVTPYFWVTFFDGTMTVDGQTIDMSGTNIFDMLDAGHLRFPPLVAYMEWNQGQWGAYFDGTLIGMEFAASDISLGSGPLTAQFGLDFTYALVNTGLSYTASEWEANGFANEFDVLAGLRYTYYDIDMSGSVGPVPITLDETLHWVDGTLGMRVRGKNADGITYSLFGEIGGGSGFSTQAIATIGKTWVYDSFDLNLFAGYRYLYQDWSSGDDAVDLTSHGPLMGLKFIF